MCGPAGMAAGFAGRRIKREARQGGPYVKGHALDMSPAWASSGVRASSQRTILVLSQWPFACDQVSWLVSQPWICSHCVFSLVSTLTFQIPPNCPHWFFSGL